MSVTNAYPVLDGVAPSWADVICRATPDGQPLIEMSDIKAIRTNSKVDVGLQKKFGIPYKRTTGEAFYESGVDFYREGYQKLLRGLLALAPKRGDQYLIALAHFQIQVQHTPPGSVEIYEYHIRGCRITGREANSQEGTDPDVVTVPMSTIQIVDIIDGKEVVML